MSAVKVGGQQMNITLRENEEETASMKKGRNDFADNYQKSHSYSKGKGYDYEM